MTSTANERASSWWADRKSSDTGFHYSRAATLILDARGVVVDLNLACRELLGLDAAGCRGRCVSFLVDRLREKGEGAALPPDGPAARYLTVSRRDPERPILLKTQDLRVATSNFKYQSDRFGRLSLLVSELPHVDPNSGARAGSVIGLEVAEEAHPGAFGRALDRRLEHELMWEVYAASYDRVLPEVSFYQEVVERHVNALRSEAILEILDLGAGTGNVAAPLLRLGKRVTAVDVSRAMLMRLRAKMTDDDASRVTVLEDTGERLPHLNGESFDAVNVLLAFFDMRDAGSALREAVRLLRPGGKLIVTEPRTCFDVRQLFAAAEEDLRKKGLFERLAPDWARIESVGPLIRDTIQREPWSAEAILDYLGQRGFTSLSFRHSHMGNCATIEGAKASD